MNRLVNELLRDQLADYKFCDRKLKIRPSMFRNIEELLTENNYMTKCLRQFQELWKVRHTVKLDRYGWPIGLKEWRSNV
jgi:hypothetical protein